MRIIISVADGHEAKDVLKELEKVGLTDGKALNTIGIISGAIPAEHLPAVRAVPGVDSVDPEQTVYAQSPSV